MPRLGLGKKQFKINLSNLKLKKKQVFVLIIFLIVFIFGYAVQNIIPTVIVIAESKSKNIGLKITNEVVSKTLKDIEYSDLVTIEKDSNGKVMALESNTIEMNRLSTSIAEGIREQLSNVENCIIKIPVGNVIGSELLSSVGPYITVEVLPAGSVITEFKTEFVSTGINQTRHRVYIEVRTYVRIVAPLITKSSEIVNSLTVAETVIVGDVPQTYYNINGLQNLDSKDTLNLIK